MRLETCFVIRLVDNVHEAARRDALREECHLSNVEWRLWDGCPATSRPKRNPKKYQVQRFVFGLTAVVPPADSVHDMPSLKGDSTLNLCSTLAPSGRNDAPYASPFAEPSAPNAVLPLQDGGS